MTGHPDPELLTAFVDGELVGEELAAVVAHVAACDRCTDAVALERATGGWLRALPAAEAPSAFLDAVLDRGPAPRTQARRHARFAAANVAAAAAVWAGVVGVAHLTTGGDPVEPALGELVQAHAAGPLDLGLRASDAGDAMPNRLAASYRLVGERVVDGRRQALYTDGTAWLSVFVESGRLDADALPVGARPTVVDGQDAWVVRVGGDEVVVVPRGDAVVVLVGADAGAGDTVVMAVEGRPPSPSVGARLTSAARGLVDSFGFG